MLRRMMAGVAQWWLRCPTGDSPLSERDLLVGRDLSCHLRFPDDTLVSRVHARFWIEKGAVKLEDLGSTNGTFIDEHRIQGRRSISLGSRVRIGSQRLWLYHGVTTPRGPRAETAGEIPIHRLRADYDDEEPLGPTGATNVFALVGPTADIAFHTGEIGEVIRILEPYMDQVLDDARRKKAVDPEIVRHGYDYALRLAESTGHGAWLDYLVELATASGIPVQTKLLDRIRAAAGRVDRMDTDVSAVIPR